MKKEEDFLRLEGKEGINIDFENLCVKKRRWNPFFLLALMFLSFAIVFAVIKIKSDKDDKEAVLVNKEVSEDWQGSFVSEAVFLKCQKASVSVIADGKICSGFVFSSDGWIVTVNSIVNEFVKGKVKVVLYDGRVLEVEAFKESRKAGLVLMKVDENGLAFADLSSVDDVSAGQEIYTFCSLDGRGEPSLFSGKISHTQRDVLFEREGERNKTLSLMQINLLLTEEGVGAPLFNEKGGLVGIACGNNDLQSQEKYMINYAFLTSKVRNLLFKMQEGGFLDNNLYGFIIE